MDCYQVRIDKAFGIANNPQRPLRRPPLHRRPREARRDGIDGDPRHGPNAPPLHERPHATDWLFAWKKAWVESLKTKGQRTYDWCCLLSR